MKAIVSQLTKLSLLCILMGCQGDDDLIRPNWFPEGWGEVNVQQNGKQWSNVGTISLIRKGQLNTTCNGYADVHFYKFSNDGYVREGLVFSGVSAQMKGRYPLADVYTSMCGNGSALVSYNTSQDDGDVGKSSYSLDNSQANYLDVTAYDSTTRRISGTFRASFIKRPEFISDDPATVTFENSQFSSPIAKKGSSSNL